MCYSIEPIARKYVKGYGFLSFARNLINMVKKLADSAKKSATDAFKIASKKAIQKTTEATGDLIGNKIAYKITKKQQNELHANDVSNEIPKKDIYLHKKDKKVLMN